MHSWINVPTFDGNKQLKNSFRWKAQQHVRSVRPWVGVGRCKWTKADLEKSNPLSHSNDFCHPLYYIFIFKNKHCNRSAVHLLQNMSRRRALNKFKRCRKLSEVDFQLAWRVWRAIHAAHFCLSGCLFDFPFAATSMRWPPNNCDVVNVDAHIWGLIDMWHFVSIAIILHMFGQCKKCKSYVVRTCFARWGVADLTYSLLDHWSNGLCTNSMHKGPVDVYVRIRKLFIFSPVWLITIWEPAFWGSKKIYVWVRTLFSCLPI